MILNGEHNPYVVLSNLGNEYLKWETSKQFNVGLDLGLYDNRLQLILEYYNKTTTDLLFPIDGFRSLNYDRVLEARRELSELIESIFGARTAVGMVDADNPVFDAEP